MMMMKFAIAAAIMALAADALLPTAAESKFKTFCRVHKKVYSSNSEYAHRSQVFHENVAKIEAHNAKNLNYVLGINQFADRTSEEFSLEMGLGKTMPKRKSVMKVDLSNVINVPSEIDWVAAGAVTPVKNQGQCGSCWSFSTTGAVEGAYFIANKELDSLSEQELVDCAGPEGNHGCGGGLMDFAFQYILDNKGICTEGSYPYDAEDEKCKSSKCKNVVAIDSFADVAQYNEVALKAAVSVQPVSVAIAASSFEFQFYKSGILDFSCGVELDHGVLAVGYGVESGKSYWKIKNSWASSWGEDGYFRMARNETTGGPGMCGIAICPSYPIVKSTQTVQRSHADFAGGRLIREW